jgi:hypothetical protein
VLAAALKARYEHLRGRHHTHRDTGVSTDAGRPSAHLVQAADGQTIGQADGQNDREEDQRVATHQAQYTRADPNVCFP